MYYTIDYDTLLPESKSEDGEILASYIIDNGFENAIAIVKDSGDLSLNFTLKELQSLSDNIGGFDTFLDEDEASEYIMEILPEWSIPVFSKKLSVKLLKEYEKKYKTSSESSKESKPTNSKVSKAKSASSTKTTSEDYILVSSNPPKQTTKLFEIWSIVDENFGEISISDLIQKAVLSGIAEERLVKRYIMKSVRLGHLEKKI